MKARFSQRAEIASPRSHHLSREQDVAHAMLALDAEESCADGHIVKRKSGHPAAPPKAGLVLEQIGNSKPLHDALQHHESHYLLSFRGQPQRDGAGTFSELQLPE
jgi:hypothetical protein